MEPEPYDPPHTDALKRVDQEMTGHFREAVTHARMLCFLHWVSTGSDLPNQAELLRTTRELEHVLAAGPSILYGPPSLLVLLHRFCNQYEQAFRETNLDNIEQRG